MRKWKLFALLATVVFLFSSAVRAQEAPIHWVVQDGHEANKARAERLYFAAVQWVEDQFGSPEQTLRPELTIRVGESCPDPEIAGACQGSWLGELYIPDWDRASAGHVVQATLTLSLLELMSRQDLRNVTEELLTEDVQNFLDIWAAAVKQ